MVKLKIGDKVKFKDRKPNIILEVVDIHKGLITLMGVEDHNYFASCTEDELIKIEQKSLDKFGSSAGEKASKTRRYPQWI